MILTRISWAFSGEKKASYLSIIIYIQKNEVGLSHTPSIKMNSKWIGLHYRHPYNANKKKKNLGRLQQEKYWVLKARIWKSSLKAKVRYGLISFSLVTETESNSGNNKKCWQCEQTGNFVHWREKYKIRAREMNGLVMNSTCWSYREPEFGSKKPSSSLQLSITPVLWDLPPSSGLHGHCTHIVNIHKDKNSYT